VVDLARLIKFDSLIQRIKDITFTFSQFDIGSEGFTGGTHSRLHVLFEKGNKSRIIAIGDYFSQSVLTPFHDLLA